MSDCCGYLDFAVDHDRVYTSPWPWLLTASTKYLHNLDGETARLDGDFLVFTLANGHSRYQMLPMTARDERERVRRFCLISGVWWRPPAHIDAHFTSLSTWRHNRWLSRLHHANRENELPRPDERSSV